MTKDNPPVTPPVTTVTALAAPPVTGLGQSARQRLIAALVLLALGLNIVIGILLWRERSEAADQARVVLESQADLLSRDFAAKLALTDVTLQAASRALFRSVPRSSFNTSGRQLLLLQHLTGSKQPPGTGSFLVADASGNIILDSRAAPPRQGNVSASEFFIAQREKPLTVTANDETSDVTDRFFVSRMVKSQLDGGLYLCVSRRLSTPDGRFAGVVFASVPFSYFAKAFDGLKLQSKVAVSLLRGDGSVLARRPQPPGSTDLNLSRSPLFSTYPASAAGSFQSRSLIDDVRRLYVYSEVPGTDLIVNVGAPLSTVYAGWFESARLLGLIAAFITLTMAGLAWMFSRDLQHRQRGHQATSRNESLFRGALDGSAIGTALFELDRRVSYVNPALAAFLGVTQNSLLGDRLHCVLGGQAWPQDHLGLRQLQEHGLNAYVVERRFERAGAAPVYGLISVTLVRSSRGNARFYIAQIQDITARVLTEKALNEQKERLQVTLASIADGVVTTDEQGIVLFVNPAAELISGWSDADSVGRPINAIFTLRDPDTGLPVKDAVRRALGSPRATPVSITGVLVDRSGWRREVACNASAVRTANDDIIGAVLVLRDVSESRELHRKLAYNASHDALTGLPNRTAFGDSLEAAVLEAQKSGVHHALAFIDLDRFKIVNDTAGHRAGDVLLKQIALLVPAQLRPDDVVGRLGGDELGVILRHCPIDDARILLERLTAAINALQFVWEGRTYTVGASIGLTAINETSSSPNTLLTEADVACYTAKNNGRNMVSVYSGEQSEAADWHRKIVLAAGIGEAINEGRIYLYAQKVQPNNPLEPARWELLSRMFDRDGSPIPTSVFIPAAERYDLMGHIDRWNLTHALGEMRRALDQGVIFPVHINLSANSLNDPEFVTDALKQIKASGVPASALTFEITETALMRNLATATVAVNSLRRAGTQVALDDFGIGLSSFGYLRNFPVDVVKIDGGFVVNMIDNPVDRNIVKSINQIAHDLGARTVAESVEDDATLQALQAMGVDFFQGYGIHRPEPLAAVIDAEITRFHASLNVPTEAITEGQ